MLDQAFEALKTYDWGVDPTVLNPIDEEVVSTQGDPSKRLVLETRLAEILKSGISRDAKDFICRRLMLIGTGASVPALAALLGEKENSHMARFALERITAPESLQALRDALGKLSGTLKIGVISSLGARADTASTPALAALLNDTDAGVSRAAACALGTIRSPEAAEALAAAVAKNGEVASAATDALLSCAEAFLADGRKNDALLVYKGFASKNQPKHVQLAATRGMLACASK